MRPGAGHSGCGKRFKSDCDCDAIRLERELGAKRTSKFDDSGTAASISGSRLSEIQDRTWTRTRADGLDGSAQCMGCINFEVKGLGSTPCRSLRGKDHTGEFVPIGDVCVG